MAAESSGYALATPDNSAAFWKEEFQNSLSEFIYFKSGS
jgi:hypothetical protein